MRVAIVCATVGLLAWAAPASARQPDTFAEDYHPPSVIESPEWGAFELRLGPYQPDAGSSFKQFYGNDRGWLFALEVDAQFIKIPKFGSVGVGLGWGWANYSGKALDPAGGSTNESAEMTIYPMNLMAVLRVDGLSKHLHVPILFAGKLGMDAVRWKSERGGQPDGSGLSPGFRWGVQAALDLNFVERAAARELDEEWGINRSFLFFEYYGSTAEGKSVRMADQTFAFGLGLTF